MLAGLFGGAGRMAQAAKPHMNFGAQKPHPSRRPRGLFGGAGQALQQNRQSAPPGDRLMMALSALGGDMTPWMQHQAMTRQEALYQRERDEERQRMEGERNTAQKGQLAERERLYQQADALGIPRDQFAFLPEETRTELLNRRYAPEAPDRPSSYEEFELASQNPAYGQFLQRNPRGTQVNVNTNPQGQRVQLGTIPPGYQAVFDEQTGTYQMQPIEGGPVERERQQESAASDERQSRDQRFAGVALDEIGRATQILQQNPRAGGAMGQALQVVGGTLSNELEGLYDTIGGYIARDTLQGMRDSSPTGGALGAINQQELEMLRAAYGALRVSDRAETQIYNLRRLNQMLNEVVHGTGAEAGTQGDGGADGAIRDGQTATNPQTGERIIFRNGRWEPLR